jgi:hypothetical protein
MAPNQPNFNAKAAKTEKNTYGKGTIRRYCFHAMPRQWRFLPET